MKCPKCGYTSFPYLENCRKCGAGLATQRAALGLYGLPPEPPDLRLAYQAVGLDLSAVLLPQSFSEPDLDIDQLPDLDLTVPSETSTSEALDLRLMFEQQSAQAAESAPSGVEQPGADEMSIPPVPQPGGLDEGIAFDLESTEDRADSAEEQPGGASQSSEEPPVYDLDLVEDLDSLTLEPLLQAGQSRASEDDEETVEYTLEIEDEVEFEIEELEVDQNDEAAEDDDDDR
jgi:hypothetical protein